MPAAGRIVLPHAACAPPEDIAARTRRLHSSQGITGRHALSWRAENQRRNAMNASPSRAAAATTVAAFTRTSGANIDDWRPEDDEFWERTGKKVAYRNLAISVPALLCGFAVWGMWGIITVQMLNLGFPFTQAELFTLTAMQIVIPLVMTVGIFGALAGEPMTLVKDSGWILGKIPAGTPTWIQNAGFAWVLSLVPLSILCWIGMNNLKTV